jgi:hypothetical protein
MNIGLVDVFAEDSLDRTKSAAAHRNAIFFCGVYHKGSERVVRNPEVIARNPGGRCNVCSKTIDGKFTGLAIERNWCTNMLRQTREMNGHLARQGSLKFVT